MYHSAVPLGRYYGLVILSVCEVMAVLTATHSSCSSCRRVKPFHVGLYQQEQRQEEPEQQQYGKEQEQEAGGGRGGRGARWTRGPGEPSGHVSAVTRRIAGGMSSNLRLSVCLSLRLSISGGGRDLPWWISSVSGLNLTRGVPNWPVVRPHRPAAALPPPSAGGPARNTWNSSF